MTDDARDSPSGEGSDTAAVRTLTVPALSLVVLVGASGSGKSTFGRAHFLPTEVLSSDFCRGLVADDENDQAASGAAFDVLKFIARKRLEAGRLTVVDATNVEREFRKQFVTLAREYHVRPVAIVLDLPRDVCDARNAARTDRKLPPDVVDNQFAHLRRSLRDLEREGFRDVHILRSVEAVAAVRIEQPRPATDQRDQHGPFDIVGDVHGCYDELRVLLERLGYAVETSAGDDGLRHHVTPPEGRHFVFVGDLVDRGPRSPDVLRIAMDMVEDGVATCIPGNHEAKLLRHLRGKQVKPSHGLAETLEQLAAEPEAFIQRTREFLEGLVSHYVLDDGRLVVAHAGIRQEMQGRTSGAVRSFCLYGETTGETDEYGLPVRYPWALDYRGDAAVVYGHTPVLDAEWVNNTICLDTACVFGGRLTALQWPERRLVSVEAAREYYAPIRPLEAPQTEDEPRL